MYIFPGYVKYYESDDAIFVESELYKNKVKISDSDLKSEFYTLIKKGGCESLDSPLTLFLHDQNLIASTNEIESALRNVLTLMEESFLITILPTESCNFRCTYCSQPHDVYFMPDSMLTKIADYIESQASKYKTIYVYWFGGEPTLCQESIVSFSRRLYSLQSKYSFKYRSSMTTNGYLLNQSSFIQLYSAGVTNYQITLDGWNHDNTRPHTTGQGTLQRILQNLLAISQLPEEHYHYQIIVRCNVLANTDNTTWYDYLHSLLGQDFRFTLSLCPVYDWGGESVHTLHLLSSKTAKDRIADDIKYLDKIGLQHKNQSHSLFSCICKSSYPHSMVFRANGKIEKCCLALDKEKNSLGKITPDGKVIIDESINHLWSKVNLKAECYTCPKVLSCFNMSCRKSLIIDGNKSIACRERLWSIH